MNWEKVPTYSYILLCTSIKQAIKLSYTYIADIKVFHVEKSYFSTFLYTRRNFSVLFSCTLTIQLSCSYLNRFGSYIITDDLLIFFTRWHSFHRIFIVTNNVANIKIAFVLETTTWFHYIHSKSIFILRILTKLCYLTAKYIVPIDQDVASKI